MTKTGSKKIIFEKVAIIGVGLLGASLALVVKKKGIARSVIGFFRKEKSAILAKRLRIVDVACFDCLETAKGADLVVLATPAEAIKKIALKVIKAMKPGAVLMDVGSTKKEIVETIEVAASRKRINFIGVHPLAGSEKSGLMFARADLFVKAICFITPGKKTDKNVLIKLQNLWKQLGAKVCVINPAIHDHIVALVSHLPHMVSFALMNSIPPDYLRFSGSGLKDCTRLASSQSEIWRDICSTNRKEILASIKRFKIQLKTLEDLLSRKDWEALEKFFLKAKLIRDNL
jgi:prephenate dehydrogenase